MPSTLPVTLRSLSFRTVDLWWAAGPEDRQRCQLSTSPLSILEKPGTSKWNSQNPCPEPWWTVWLSWAWCAAMGRVFCLCPPEGRWWRSFLCMAPDANSSAASFDKLIIQLSWENGCGASSSRTTSSSSYPSILEASSSLMSGSSPKIGTGTSSQWATGWRADWRSGDLLLPRFFLLIPVTYVAEHVGLISTRSFSWSHLIHLQNKNRYKLVINWCHGSQPRSVFGAISATTQIFCNTYETKTPALARVEFLIQFLGWLPHKL